MKRPFSMLGSVLALALATIGLTPSVGFASTGGTNADPTTHNSVVSAVPSAQTPNVDDGTVLAFAQVGNTMVVGGHFTGVTDNTGHIARKNLFAFDLSTGNLITAFAPKLDGDVNSLVPGPTAGTVIVGGEFNVVSGAKSKALVTLDVSSGARIKAFKPAVTDGGVNVIKRAGDRLFVGGSFTTLDGSAHGGIGTVNATTGELDSFVSSTVEEHHNWRPGSNGSKGNIGVTDLAITPDGTHMVAIGNFKTVDGLSRDQAAVFDLTGAQAVVQANWHTQGFQAACYGNAFDATVRAVDVSPDGKYFVVASTGGGSGTLCDSAARFEFSATGDNIQPTWVSYAGGDSLFSVAITGAAIYVGGHQRWMNDPNCADCAGSGAVPRPGLAAIDPTTGIPLDWNPGRNPRGAGAYSIFATPSGLWVGSDTDFIGNYRYKRMKMAFFPLAGGAPVAADSTPALPGNVYLGTAGSGSSNVLYRVDAGGNAVQSLDAGPDWSDDSGSSSTLRNSGSNAASYDPVPHVDSTVPTSTPRAIFDTERWDPGHGQSSDNLTWSFPVTAGTQVDVRLYFANRCTCTSASGSRKFNVTVNGDSFLSDFDIVASAGDQTGTMRDVEVTSNGTVTISFSHSVENPLVNGIELVKVGGGTTAPTESWSTRSFNGTSAGGASAAAVPVSTVTTRAATMIGGKLYTAGADGTFASHTFNGNTFGPEVDIDPYHDPAWANISNGSGGLYDGSTNSFYSQMPNLSSMFYDPSTSRLYYTLFNSSGLYYRTFSADSGILFPNATQVSGVSLPVLSGAFLTGGNLYYVSRADGVLHKVGFASATGGLTGSATSVSGPAIDGVNWSNRTLFLGPLAAVTTPPTSSFTANCTGLTCSFDGRDSSSPNGGITGYAWDFGDDKTGTGSTTSHTYDEAGPHTVVLTVTDAKASAASTKSVNPQPRAVTATASGTCADLTCTFTATGSSPDGSIVSYDWDFGDGETGTGATATHPYAEAGPYTATVTVTDDAAGTATATADVTPSAPVAGAIQFRGEVGVSQNQAKPNLTLPSSVQPGDTMLLFVSTNKNTTQATPAGWSVLGTQRSQALLTTVFQRTATSADAGTKVTVNLGASAKTDLHVAVYSGALPASDIKLAPDTAGTQVAPAAEVASSGSWVVRYYADRTSSTTAWTAPAGVTTRDSLIGKGGGRVSTLLVDSGAGVPTGSTGTATATSNAANGRAVSLTIVLPTA